MDTVYKSAMDVIGILFESGEWPELKEKLHDKRVVVKLNVFVTSCLDLKKSDASFASYGASFFEGKWDEITPEYWIEFRRLKTEMEKATKVQEEAYEELMDLIEEQA